MKNIFKTVSIFMVVMPLGITAQNLRTVVEPVGKERIIGKHKFTDRKANYILDDTCTYTMQWVELILPDVNVAQKINAQVKGVRSGYILSPSDHVQYCQDHVEYGITAKVEFAGKDYVSYNVFASVYYQGAAHPNTQFVFANYAVANAAEVTLNDLVKPESRTAFNSLAVDKLRGEFLEKNGTDLDAEMLSKQAGNLDFSFAENGIVLHFRGDTYATTLIDLLMPYDELKPYLHAKYLPRN